jgi:hypothetical protein
MRALALLVALASLPVMADEWPVRPSLGVGLLSLYPQVSGNKSADSEFGFQLDVTLERGGFFGGFTYLECPGDGSSDDSFVGVKLGYVFADWPAAPYAAASIGSVHQWVLFPFDEGTFEGARGLGFAFEAGAVVLRRAGIGRVWLFAMALLPTFSVKDHYSSDSATVRSLGFGVRTAF